MSTIIRVSHNRTNPYVTINKTCLEDERLSWKAKGLLAYLLSRPDNWTVYSCELEKRAEDGERSVRSGLKELENHGYLERRRIRKQNEQGKWGFAGWETVVYEQPLKLVKPEPKASVPKRRFAVSQNVELQNVELQNSSLINKESLSNEQPINDNKEKKAAKITKRKDKEVQQTWFDLARASGIVAARVNKDRVVTGTKYELGPGCTRQIDDLKRQYPLEALQTRRLIP